MNPLQRRTSSWYNKLDALFQLVAGIKNRVQNGDRFHWRSDAVSDFFAMAQPLLRPRYPRKR